jgi:hypothetical protein
VRSDEEARYVSVRGTYVALTMSFGGVAFAKITPVDTSCTNGGGNQPGEQQPTCTGGGLTQDTENQNPAGHAPPGAKLVK